MSVHFWSLRFISWPVFSFALFKWNIQTLFGYSQGLNFKPVNGVPKSICWMKLEPSWDLISCSSFSVPVSLWYLSQQSSTSNYPFFQTDLFSSLPVLHSFYAVEAAAVVLCGQFFFFFLRQACEVYVQCFRQHKLTNRNPFSNDLFLMSQCVFSLSHSPARHFTRFFTIQWRGLFSMEFFM